MTIAGKTFTVTQEGKRDDLITITFEGVGDFNQVGTQSGVVFGPAWIAGVDNDAGGSLNIANEPSPDTVAWIYPYDNLTQTDTRIILPNPVNQISFYYTLDTSTAPSVAVYFYDRNDALLGTESMNICGCVYCGCSCSGDPTGDWCYFEKLTANYVGIKYIEFQLSGAGYWAFDNFSFLKSANRGFLPAIFRLLLDDEE